MTLPLWLAVPIFLLAWLGLAFLIALGVALAADRGAVR